MMVTHELKLVTFAQDNREHTRTHLKGLVGGRMGGYALGLVMFAQDNQEHTLQTIKPQLKKLK